MGGVNSFSGQDSVHVGHDDTACAEEIPQVRDGPLGRIFIEPRPEGRSGQVRSVQRAVCRPLCWGAQTSLTVKGKADNPGDQDDHGDQCQPKGLFHGTPNGKWSSLSLLLFVPCKGSVPQKVVIEAT